MVWVVELRVGVLSGIEIRQRAVDPVRLLPRLRLDVVQVLLFPHFGIAACERWSEVDLDIERDRRRTAVSPGQLGEGLAASREDEHHGPVAATEHAVERLDINGAGLSGVAGVGVDPDPTELFRLSALVDLVVEELGDGGVIEGNVHLVAALRHEGNVTDVEQIARVGDAESADFGRAEITQTEQLGPRGRAEPQLRSGRREAATRSSRSRLLPTIGLRHLHLLRCEWIRGMRHNDRR